MKMVKDRERVIFLEHKNQFDAFQYHLTHLNNETVSELMCIPFRYGFNEYDVSIVVVVVVVIAKRQSSIVNLPFGTFSQMCSMLNRFPEP